MNKHKLDEKSIAEPKATTAAKFEAPILWGLLTVALLIWLTSLPNKFVSDDIPTILDNAKVGIWSFDLFRPWWSFQ